MREIALVLKWKRCELQLRILNSGPLERSKGRSKKKTREERGGFQERAERDGPVGEQGKRTRV